MNIKHMFNLTHTTTGVAASLHGDITDLESSPYAYSRIGGEAPTRLRYVDGQIPIWVAAKLTLKLLTFI